MKVLMTGPGKGHNIHRFLKWFNTRHQEYSFYFHHYNRGTHYKLQQFSNITVIGTYSLVRFIKTVRSANIIWVHNWTPWPFLLLILLFKNKRTVLNFNFWSEKLPKTILENKGLKSKFYRHFFKRCSVLQTSWFSVKNLVDQFNHPNSRLMRWGFEEEYFQEIDEKDLSEFTKEFVRQLPEEKFKFFVPKTIGFPNRHDLMVKAARLLVEEGVLNFKIYFWKGNRVESQVEAEIIKLIQNSGVEEYIEIVTHPFLSNKDIAYIWQQMDCGLQLCDEDQLTSAFTEPQLFLKPVIASHIASYITYNQYYKVNVPLVKNSDVPGIAAAMRSEITRVHSASEEELLNRQSIIKQFYRFADNMEGIMAYFRALLTKMN